MRIPLPKMMRHYREREYEQRLSPPTARAGLGVWAFLARRPRLYRPVAALAAVMLALLGRRGAIRWLPLAGGWTAHRDLPAPAGRTFHELWQAGER